MFGVPLHNLLLLSCDDLRSAQSKKIIAFKIKVLRYAKGLTRRALAKKINISKSKLGSWEIAQIFPKPEDMVALAKFFGISVSRFLTGISLRDFLRVPVQNPFSALGRRIFGMKFRVLRLQKGWSYQETARSEEH